LTLFAGTFGRVVPSSADAAPVMAPRFYEAFDRRVDGVKAVLRP
jgi:hypothetical protein